MKKLFALLLIAAMVLTACGGGTDADQPKDNGDAEVEQDSGDVEEEKNGKEELSGLDKIKKEGKLIVATSADYPPYGFILLKDGKEEFVGFDMDLARYIAEQLGVECEIRNMDFKNVINSVQSGMADIAIAGINPKPERMELVDFSDVYYEASHGALVKKDNAEEYQANEDLEGKKIGVQMGSLQQEIASGIEGAEVIALPLVTTLVQELKTNKVDALLLEFPVAESFAENHDDLVVADGVEFMTDDMGSAIAVQKGNEELLDEINAILQKVLDEGLLDQWYLDAKEKEQEQQL